MVLNTMAVGNITWQHLPFDALSTTQLYAALQLRSEVFVVEQNCVFQDIDGYDTQSMHVLGLASDKKLVAYARCSNAGLKFAEASIGRVITHASVRGAGAGYALVQHAIDCIQRTWGAQPIRIGAQAHLDHFYGKLGFVKTGAIYLEDGIPHTEMLRT
jgi:ElaA protein